MWLLHLLQTVYLLNFHQVLPIIHKIELRSETWGAKCLIYGWNLLCPVIFVAALNILLLNWLNN